MPLLAFFAHERTDARVHKRIAALSANGWQVRGYTFHRIRPGKNDPAPWDDVNLGITRDRAYVQRVWALLRSVWILWQDRRRLKDVGAYTAINFDNALLALLARRFAGTRAPIIVEIADIQPPMVGSGWKGRLLRGLEKWVLNRSQLLVTTSPGFIRHYFEPLLRWSGPTFLLENKVWPGVSLAASKPEHVAPPSEGEPWVIGWFGAFRCARSWATIQELAKGLPKKVRFVLRGYPTAIDRASFESEVQRYENIHWGGPYSFPKDLAEIYGQVHLSWAFDFHDATANSRWLLPNRLYEGGLYRVPPLTAEGTETGHWAVERQLGWAFGEPLIDHLVDFLSALTPEAWQAKRDEAARLPESAVCGEADYAALSQRILELSKSLLGKASLWLMALLLAWNGRPACAASWQDYYDLETIVMPAGLDPQVGAVGVMPDGRVACAFHRGEVLIYDPVTKNWKEFARGLHEPLGLLVESDKSMLVMQRAELTSLRDANGDGTADHYDTVWDDFGLTGNYHEFAYGPVKDPSGKIYVALNLASPNAGPMAEMRGTWSAQMPVPHAEAVANWPEAKKKMGRMYAAVPWRGWIMEVDLASGKASPFSCGFRSPDGLAIAGASQLWVTDNQGDWVGTSGLFHSKKGHFHSHPASLVWHQEEDLRHPDPPSERVAEMRTPAAILFPHGTMASSPTGVAEDTTEGKFGPWAGQLFVGEMNTPRLLRVMPDEVNGVMQGAVTVGFEGGGLHAGQHRLAFSPDGSLWLGQIHLAWAGGEGLQRLKWKGKAPPSLLKMHLIQSGFQLDFSTSLTQESLVDLAKTKVRRYRYLYHASYGSPQTDVTPLSLGSMAVSHGGKRLTLNISNLTDKGTVVECQFPEIKLAEGRIMPAQTVCYTINSLSHTSE